MTRPKLSETLNALGKMVSCALYYNMKLTGLDDALALLERAGIMRDGKFVDQWGVGLERFDGGESE